MEVIEGDTHPTGARIGIIAARFNSFIVEHLVQGALGSLRSQGIEDAQIEVLRVPGAFELPLAAKTMARRGTYDALIALGCVIRGATPHFEFIAAECARGLARVALDFDIPVAFGVLTTDTLEQAIERAGSKAGNKGAEAACSALEMVSALRKLGG